MAQHDNVYIAPITLGFTPADGDLIRGTINGVEVSGEWMFNGVTLFDSSKNYICTVGFNGPQSVLVVSLPSAPTTDYELHLYRYTPEGIVQIPQRYVDGLEEITANANQALETATAAQNTATAAQSTADAAKSKAEIASNVAYTAQSTANTAQSTADTAKITANTAKNTADTAKSTADTAKTMADAAQRTALEAFPSSGMSPLRLRGNKNKISGNMTFEGIANGPIYCYVDRSSESDPYAPARFIFVPNAAPIIQVEGIDVLQMKSTGGKKFNLTVDDTGAISATEVT